MTLKNTERDEEVLEEMMQKYSQDVREIRVIRWYNIHDDELVGEYRINAALEDLQKIFNEPSNEPMYYSYRISFDEAKYFQPLLKDKIDFERYEYFLECYQEMED